MWQQDENTVDLSKGLFTEKRVIAYIKVANLAEQSFSTLISRGPKFSQSLCGVNLADAAAIAIADLLKKNKHITSVDLQGNAIGFEGFEALLVAIKESPQLKDFKLAKNQIPGLSDEQLNDIDFLRTFDLDKHIETLYSNDSQGQPEDPYSNQDERGMVHINSLLSLVRM